MSQLNITELPTEILEKIFSNLGKRSLLRLTETCKLFNTLVLEFNLIKLCIQPHEGSTADLTTVLGNSQRKYSSLALRNLKWIRVNIKQVLNVLSNLKYLELHRCAFDSSVVYTLFKNFSGTLKEIVIRHTELVGNWNGPPINWHQLRKVALEATYNKEAFIRFFGNANSVKDFELDSPLQPDQISFMLAVLTRFKSLKNIKVEGVFGHLFLKFFTTEQTVAHNINLEKLSIWMDDPGTDELIHDFSKFLTTYEKSLKVLKLNGTISMSLIEACLKANCLTEFHLDLHKFCDAKTITQSSSSIEKLSLDYDLQDRSKEVIEILKNCPSVRFLKICAPDCGDTIISAIAKYLPNVKVLELTTNQNLSPISIPSLQYLILNNLFAKQENFIQANPKIKTISYSVIKDLLDLEDFISTIADVLNYVM